MSVDLSSGNRGVAEELLNLADIGAIGQQVGSKRVTKSVRSDFFGDAGLDSVFFDQTLDRAGS